MPEVIAHRIRDRKPRTSSIFRPRSAVQPMRGLQSAVALPKYPANPAWGAHRDDLAQQCFLLLNQHRHGIGSGQLTLESDTTGALGYDAWWKTLDMAHRLYMAHDDPADGGEFLTGYVPPFPGRQAGDRILDGGYPGYDAWGENIAYNFLTAADVMAAWLSDDGHKANLENPLWTTVGIGCATVNQHIPTGDGSDIFGAMFWVQDFGTAFVPVGGGQPAPPPVPPVPPTPPVPPAPEPPKYTIGSRWSGPTGTAQITALPTGHVTYALVKARGKLGPVKPPKTVAQFEKLFPKEAGHA